MSDSLKEEALRYHRFPTAGKVSVTPTKALDNQRDLSLAYSPGVAFACQAIEADPLQADFLTSRANLVAVISNGSAVLGLGNIGALAGKPVMEGKGVLFKKFAGIDVFDIEVDQADPEKFIEAVAALEPTGLLEDFDVHRHRPLRRIRWRSACRRGKGGSAASAISACQ